MEHCRDRLLLEVAGRLEQLSRVAVCGDIMVAVEGRSVGCSWSVMVLVIMIANNLSFGGNETACLVVKKENEQI